MCPPPTLGRNLGANLVDRHRSEDVCLVAPCSTPVEAAQRPATTIPCSIHRPVFILRSFCVPSQFRTDAPVLAAPTILVKYTFQHGKASGSSRLPVLLVCSVVYYVLGGRLPGATLRQSKPTAFYLQRNLQAPRHHSLCEWILPHMPDQARKRSGSVSGSTCEVPSSGTYTIVLRSTLHAARPSDAASCRQESGAVGGSLLKGSGALTCLPAACRANLFTNAPSRRDDVPRGEPEKESTFSLSDGAV